MPFAEFGAKIVSQDGKQFFRRIPYDVNNEKELLEVYRNRYHNTDVYRSVFTYETSDLSSAKISGPLYFDLDFDINLLRDNRSIRAQAQHCIMTLQQYLKIPSDQIYLYFSGGKGYHITVPSEVLGLGYCERRVLIKNYKDFAALIKEEWKQRYHTDHCIDIKVYDSRRMFRLPNSLNRTGQRYKILLPGNSYSSVDYSDLNSMSLIPSCYQEEKGHFCMLARMWWDFLTEDNTPIEHNTSTVKKQKKYRSNILPCVTAMLGTSVSVGNRNNTAVVLASALLQHDLSFDEVINTMILWNQNNTPPLPEDELYNTIRSARTLSEKDWSYGCTSIKELGFCNGKCKVRKD